ncbi:glutathione S-transferase 1-1-like [Diorhabda sublineata]|uniref:glutathione S-transferase 1-1-like n=1 Tax=Diorhabda sublineata TaxID=1163346 RepID=UPI0024E04168|nr:glutathione S-transferase 1-1-like [Diorhabda sublineata]
MAPQLYGDIRSPCVRAVLLTAKALNISLEYIPIDVVKKEHLTKEYLKINPCHTVPALIDNGFTLWDSHAIMIYLAETYGNNNPIYPKDIKKQAIINQMLHFENGKIFSIHVYIADLLLHRGIKKIPEEAATRQIQGYEFVETFLTNSKFIAGYELTIADFSAWTSLSDSNLLVPIEKNKYPRIIKWVETLEQLAYGDINKKGVMELAKLFNTIQLRSLL